MGMDRQLTVWWTCLHVLVATNNAAVNTCVHVLRARMSLLKLYTFVSLMTKCKRVG